MTIGSMLAAVAATVPGASALRAERGGALSYTALLEQANGVARTLEGLGVVPGDRVALVLPNGPDAATAFLGVTMAGAAAPLNPGFREKELQLALADLRPRALLLDTGLESPAGRVAERMGIPVLALSRDGDAPAGVFRVNGRRPAGAPARGALETDDALVLHTSGTTSRPKQVPLTHANLLASARQVARTLRLSPDDVCLNVMPLFHIHGLVAALLAPLSAGGSVVATPGLLAPRVASWLREHRPTYLTAVPTILHALLARSEAETLETGSLRFLRSSSAALSTALLARLEEAFGVPVVEAYGMTEAAHQMASNPLPPGERRPGSVGPAAGPEVGVMDARGALLERGARGEVVIRGPNVTRGYEGNPEANARAFTNSWFRTGDEGWMSEDGFLTLTGRIKEQISRGGEKIAPLEIDEALTRHPAVAQAVAFAVPHATLGEEVAAAVVLRPGATATEHELRAFAAERLADFKVPRRVVTLDEIPKGPTGKLQRIGLAERIGLTQEALAPAPRAAGRAEGGAPAPVRLFAEVLERPVRPDDDFFAMGGDSLLAARLLARIHDALGVRLSFLDLLDHPTPAALAPLLERPREERAPAIARLPREGLLPLSFAQEGLWFVQQRDLGSTALVRPALFRIRGRLDRKALEKALSEVAARHEPLRTTFPVVDGRPFQRIAPPSPRPLPLTDLSAGGWDAARRVLAEEASRPFDLERGPVWRARLLRLAPDEHLLSFTAHHLVFDGTSDPILLRETAACLAAFSEGGTVSPLPPLAHGFADYAAWERQALAPEVLERKLRAVTRRLAGMPEMRLPGHGAPRAGESAGAGFATALSSELSAGLEGLSRARSVTLFMTLLAGFQALLRLETGQEDVTVGTDSANRLHPAAEPLIGFFVNLLPLRTDLSGDPTFDELLRRVRAVVSEAQEHRDVPFPSVVSALRPGRAGGGTPLLRALLVQGIPAPAESAGGVTIEPLAVESPARFDLALFFERHGERLTLRWRAKRALLDEASLRRLSLRLESFLARAVAAPGERLPVLARADAPASSVRPLAAARRRPVDIENAPPARSA